jgi:predicted ribosome quality control (RQC) complex YloA/Tae2 family protein
MHELTSLELGVVVGELKPRLANSYLKKFYDIGSDAFRMSFHGPSGNVEVYCKILLTLNETRFKEEVGEATKFAMAIRKRIEDSRIFDVYQHGSDRIVIFEFGTKEGRYKLIIEMFGKGNLILVNEAGKIELCSKSIYFRNRSVKPGFDYILPKSDSFELSKLKKENVEKLMDTVSGSQNKMITEISKFINIGPIYLDDVIRGAGLDPRNALEHMQVPIITDAFLKFFEELKTSKPIVYFENGKIVEYSLVKLNKYKGFESKEFASFGELLDEVHIESRQAKGDNGASKDLEELNSTIDKQKELVQQFVDESVRCEEEAKKIFENMNDINSIIYYLQENKRATIEEVQKEFPDLKIEKINLKDKKVILEM